MFDTINIHFNCNEHTAGQLAECLLFYDQVNLIAKIDDMATLIQTIGFDELVELGHYGFRIVTTDATLGILPYPKLNNSNEVRVITGILQNEDLTHRYLSKSINKALQITGNKLENCIKKLRDVTDLYLLGNEITKLIHEEILSPFANYLLYKELEEKGAGDLISKGILQYSFSGNEKSIKLETNMSNPYLSKEIDRLQVRSILDHNRFILDVATSILFIQQSIHYKGEMMTTISEERIISLKLNMLQDTLKKGYENIKLVQKMANPKYYSIADSLDNGKKSYKEFVSLLEKSQKFKEWKHSISEEADFITEYCNAVATESKWKDNMIVKLGRWLFTSIVGNIPIVGPVAGMSVSAIDTFIVDNMLKKWTPNQFLQTDVRKFCEGI